MTDLPINFGGPDEYYSDSAKMAVGPYGVSVEFGVATSANEVKTNAIVRMSPQHALVLCQLMRKNLKAYQEQVGKINLPDALFEELGIDKEL